MAKPRLASVSLDCADAEPLARFWAELLGGEVAYVGEEFCAVKTPGGTYLATVLIPDYVPPTWPSGPSPKQFHLDLAVTDLDEAVAEALALGAELAGEQPAPERYRVLFDPAGHPFCVTTGIPD